MKLRPRHHSGMTTIELMIVITILGILAMLVYPHFDYATQDAEDNVHLQQLKMIRMAIQLYQIQHGGNLPNLVASWDDLTKQSVDHGHVYGPYLQEVPKNHKRSNVFNGSRSIRPRNTAMSMITATGAGRGGFGRRMGVGRSFITGNEKLDRSL